ncbi:MAG: 50S ribosomal protein L29 [Chloroflexi bacterium]|nr:50S ribosomal protein L29 [Chloroflexota bacterium]
MDMEEIRALNDDQLQEELENAHRELFNLRFRAVTRQLANTSEVGKARKSVAQFKTVIRERQLEAFAVEETA